MNDLVYIYPAFGEKLAEKDILFFYKHKEFFGNYLKEIKYSTHAPIINLIESYDEIINDEFYSQCVAYIYSCAVSDILKRSNLIPAYSTGYSLGLYAALYNAGSITLNDGLVLIQTIFNLILEEIKNKNFGIAVIIGLEKKDIEKIINENSGTTEIINVNNKYSFVIAGLYSQIKHVLSLSIDEGGINSKLLPIRAPYHSRFVLNSSDRFMEFIINNIKINDAEIPVVSTINQKIIYKAEDIKNEIVGNIKSNINWNDTFQKLLSLNCKNFIECGIGKSLSKIGKFIEGEYRILSYDKL